MILKPEMEVYVPSRSRFERSLTLEALEGAWPKDKITLLVPFSQRKEYEPLVARHHIKFIAVPKDGIAWARYTAGQFAEKFGSDKFLMLDDDLRFTHRPGPAPQLVPCTRRMMRAMLYTVQIYLDTFAHVAISARGGNNTLPIYAVENSRPLRALAYRAREFNRCRHGRVEIMEDFDVTMQLLRKGFKNAVITSYAQDQGQTQLPGGCSDYRTHELHERNVRKFASLHRPFVTLREKNNKTGGEFGKRLEATIYWEKAYASSKG